MFLLSGALKVEAVTQDQLRRLLARYFSSRNWKVEESESSLTAYVGAPTDLLFRGYVFYCKQVDFDLSQPATVKYRFTPNWIIIGLAAAMFSVAGVFIAGTKQPFQEIIKLAVSIGMMVPVYSFIVLAQLRSVVLRDLKAVVHKV